MPRKIPLSSLVGKKVRNFLFRARTRPVLRNSRVVFKTPKVRGKRLLLKKAYSQQTDLRERKVRNAVLEFHQDITPKTYSLRLSKRYPSIQGKRTELYYDAPSLYELVEGIPNKRSNAFLRKNSLSSKEAQKIAVNVSEELEKNIYHATQHLNPDFNLGSVVVLGWNGKKLDLVMVDV